MEKSYKAIAGLLGLLILLITSTSCLSAPISPYEDTRDMMDTYVRIVVYTDADSADEVLDAAFARMQEVVDIASTFDAESEAFKLNQDGSLETPPAELLEIIETSIDYSELSNGYFDITVQPLLDLWSYNPALGPDEQFWALPPEEQEPAIDEAKFLAASFTLLNLALRAISFYLSVSS